MRPGSLVLLLQLITSRVGMCVPMSHQPDPQHTANAHNSRAIYVQPPQLDLRSSAFPNPRHWPPPDRVGQNITNIVFWQHAIPNLTLTSPTQWPLQEFTGVHTDPTQQAITSARVPFSGAQYKDSTLGLWLNTTGTAETLTTSTIESKFSSCLDVWAPNRAIRVSLDLAAPSASHCTRSEGIPCAIYSSLSLNVHSRNMRWYTWYETSLFDHDRPAHRDAVFFDQSSQKPIVHGFVADGEAGPRSKYNTPVQGSDSAFNHTSDRVRHLEWIVASTNLEVGISDVANRFNLSGLPASASDWCVGGFNVELEGTPDTTAGIRVHNLTLELIDISQMRS